MTDYTLIFDGGSLGNPGAGYGSYQLRRNADGKQRTRRLDFGNRITSNVAEYLTLIAGLEDLAAIIKDAGKDPGRYSVCVWGDSRLVVEQMNGRWKVKAPGLQVLHARAVSLLRTFGPGSRIDWHVRQNSVAALGH